MKNTYSYIFAFLMAFTAITCEKPPSKTKPEVMQEKLDSRLDRWKKGVERVCLKKVMEEAEAIVDSTLLADARFKRDTSDIPAIPGRPDRPDFVPPEDTVAVKPIFEKGDTLDGELRIEN